jgi:hypothetical protein
LAPFLGGRPHVTRALRICRDESAARREGKIAARNLFSATFSGVSHNPLRRASHLSRRKRSAAEEIEGAVNVEPAPNATPRNTAQPSATNKKRVAAPRGASSGWAWNSGNHERPCQSVMLRAVADIERRR